MRSGGNGETADEKTVEKKRTKRYVLVARSLVKCRDFTTSKTLADDLKMEPQKFRASVQRAKELMASHGYMVTNRVRKGAKNDATGYKRATFEEFKAEIHKSCARATAHLMQALKLCSLLEASGQFGDELQSLKDTLLGNASKISFPNIEKDLMEFDDIKPDFVDDIAEDEVEEDSEEG